MRTSIRLAASLLFLGATALAPAALALPVQDDADAPGDASQVESPDGPFEVPQDVSAAVDIVDDLESIVEDMDDAAAEDLLGTYLALAREQRDVLDDVAAAPDGSPEAEREPAVRADLGTLVSATERLKGLLVARGVDVAYADDQLEAIRPPEKESTDIDAGAAPSTREEALALEPEILRAKLRPLTVDEVDERLSSWLGLLRQTCLEIRDVEVAGMKTSDEDAELRFQERAVLLRGERSRLLERVDVVIGSFEEKGGDATGAKAYVKSVVATPPITGWKAALRTSVTWLKSPDGGIAVGIRILAALGILFAAYLISRLLARITRKAVGRIRGASSLLKEFLVSTVRRGAMLIGILIALSTLGVSMGPLLAAIGAAGLVVGLALQGTLGNLASGLMIMVFRPFDVGDVVDVAGASGEVLGMTLMTTTIRTFDNRTIHVPNSMIWGDVITNVTANQTRRVDMVFGIDYGDDTGRAREILEEILDGSEKVLKDPAPLVRLHELADSSVNFIVRPWAKTADYWDVFWDVTSTVKARFDAEGISIPFPQRDVHIISNSGESPPIPTSTDSDPSESTSADQQEVPSDS
ncbi:MAG: mechanosensitive ion channel family protein [Planctomycetota bacterium]